jgi:hypothetical protein
LGPIPNPQSPTLSLKITSTKYIMIYLFKLIINLIVGLAILLRLE